MKMTNAEKNEFISHVSELLTSDQVYGMMNFTQHGNTSTFTHCLIVSYYSYLLSQRLRITLDSQSLVRGAMLHDFYLYDWHIPEKSHKLHGFVHPKIALYNARQHFRLNKIEEDIIEKHMWPLTIHKVPTYRESVIVMIVDKICSLTETFYLPMLPNDLKQLMKLITKQNLSY